MIYVLEDDRSIRELVVYTLNQTGLPAQGFEKPSEFKRAVEEAVPSLVLLDIMLPEEDGLQVLHYLRTGNATRNLPIIMLTAKTTEYDKVLGLDNGADDYIPKPFGMMELIARVKAMLRRSTQESASGDDSEYKVGDLKVSVSKHSVTAANKGVLLTFTEFELLVMLMKYKGTVLTRDRILNEIWGYDFDGESRTVDVHIRTLRRKLGDAGNLIETVRGIGYKIPEDV